LASLPASSTSRLRTSISVPTGTGDRNFTVSSPVTYIGCFPQNTMAAHPIVSSRSAETTPPWATFLYPLRWGGRITLARTSFPSTKNRACTPERFSSPQRKHPDECGRYSLSGGSRSIPLSYQRRAPPFFLL